MLRASSPQSDPANLDDLPRPATGVRNVNSSAEPAVYKYEHSWFADLAGRVHALYETARQSTIVNQHTFRPDSTIAAVDREVGAGDK